jgi:hypothetical protein
MYALAIAYHEAGDGTNARHFLEGAAQRAATHGQNQLAAQINATMAQAAKH